MSSWTRYQVTAFEGLWRVLWETVEAKSEADLERLLRRSAEEIAEACGQQAGEIEHWTNETNGRRNWRIQAGPRGHVAAWTL